jgi:hypothetical protein
MYMWEEVESAEGARDEGCCHSQRPSTIPPHSVSLPPSSSASQAEARGPLTHTCTNEEETYNSYDDDVCIAHIYILHTMNSLCQCYDRLDK